jgi:acetyl esterase/lipase
MTERGARSVRKFQDKAFDLYVPDGADTLCVYLHGGGWRLGDRTQGPGAAARWQPSFFETIAGLGLAIATVSYRKSFEAVYPAQSEDVTVALRRLASERTAYGITGDRTVTWGVSAGGHLAALAALDADNHVQAAACWYPPTDFDALSKDIDEAGGTGDRSADSREGQLIGASLDERPDLAAAASPVHHVHPGAPPFLLVHGTADLAVPPRQSERLAEALREAGTDVTVELIPGATHMFPELDDDATMSLIRRTVAFLRG